jgi:hypothetical protein
VRIQLGCLAVLLVVTLAGAADKEETLRSGPQVGKTLPGTFEVRNCNGPDTGDTTCLV